MTNQTSIATNQDLNRFKIRRIIQLIIGIPLFFALFLFFPAGTINWLRGWLFLLVFLGSEAIIGTYLWHKNPELLIARSQFHKGTKRWDKILLCFLFPTLISIFPIAALDAVRFQWSVVPYWVSVLGYLPLLFGLALATWAGRVNKFAEMTVRIQKERSHQVIDSGPYRIVRHPGYAASFFIFVGISLTLGSWWALIPALLTCLLLVLRTQLEDKTLQEELEGYREYTERVNYKLIPYIW